MQPRIAQASSDVPLAVSREEVLRQAGYEVHTVASSHELTFACANQMFDLLLVGHSLEFAEGEDIRATFRKLNHRAPIVQLVSEDESTGDADYSINVYNGPAALMQLLKNLLEGSHFEASSGGK